MPGLIRGVARTAVVAGTATAVSNRVSRRQANRWASQAQASEPRYEEPRYEEPPPPEPAPQASQDDVLSQLERLGALHTSGVLTDAEFAAQKARLLGT